MASSNQGGEQAEVQAPQAKENFFTSKTQLTKIIQETTRVQFRFIPAEDWSYVICSMKARLQK